MPGLCYALIYNFIHSREVEQTEYWKANSVFNQLVPRSILEPNSSSAEAGVCERTTHPSTKGDKDSDHADN